MSVLHELLESEVVQRLGWTILHSLWEGAAVAAVLAILLALLRKHRPEVRYLLSCGAMLALLIAPVATFVLLPDAPSAARPVATVASSSGSMQPASQTIVVPVRLPIDTPAATAPVRVTLAAPIEPAVPSIRHDSRLSFSALLMRGWNDTLDWLASLVPWLVLTWAAGVLALSLWNLGGFVAVHQLKRASIEPAGAAAERLARRLADRMGIHRAVRVVGSARAQTPLVIGALKPVILVPLSALCELPASELESILAHELAHVRRHDYLVNLLQSAIATLLFYHPAAWWISRRISIEREHCCDDLVLKVTRDRATYARALAAVASVRIPALSPAASGGKLLPRLRRIVGAPEVHAAKSSSWIAGAVVVACCAVFAMALRTEPAPAAERGLPATPTHNAGPAQDMIHVRGVVLLPDGKPAAHASVEIAPNWRQDDPNVPSDVLSRTTSGADGRFQIAFDKSKLSPFILDDGSSGRDLWKKAAVIARADGFGLAWSAWDKTDSNGDVVLKLVPDLPIEGRIVDLEGRPVPNVKVRTTGLMNRALVEFSD
ncbi:MAG TPA: M56 family metallopeptidase [Tepidisphaeraceae bacterium]|nr:M56 family metallopeptidase [Tepidisphaeraceae bacterium]